MATNPSRAEQDRIARFHGRVHVLFDPGSLEVAIEACRRLHARDVELVAVRGRLVPQKHLDLFDEIWLGDGLLPLLRRPGWVPPRIWSHPVVTVEVHGHGKLPRHLGAVFSRLPEPGMLDFSDIGRAGVREGAGRAALPVALVPEEITDVLGKLGRGGADCVLLIDNGGDVESLATELLARRRLAAYFGPARRPLPAAVRKARVAVYRWFEPEDFECPAAFDLPPDGEHCAFVPVPVEGEDVPRTTARLLGMRSSGYDFVVPRFHVPVPNTTEWRTLSQRHPPRPCSGRSLEGDRVVFPFPGFEPASGPELLHLWARPNRWPARRVTCPEGSLDEVGSALRRYLSGNPSRICGAHGREMVTRLLGEMDGESELGPWGVYPFVAWRGRSVLEIVEEAIERRLSPIGHAPESLTNALRHTATAGGKRIRPILALALAAVRGVPLESALRPALAIEWLHTASLIQDDLPCMDDDPVRRGVASVHERHGEGIAILASDALVALALEDLVTAGRDPVVGESKALRLIEQAARAIGASGLAGGQAADLGARETRPLTVSDLVEVHCRKTVPLFRLAASFASILADVEEDAARDLEDRVADLGLAFQVVDDLLDESSGSGPEAGSDRRNGAATFATLLERDEARRFAESLVEPLFSLSRAIPGLGRLARFTLDRAR